MYLRGCAQAVNSIDRATFLPCRQRRRGYLPPILRSRTPLSFLPTPSAPPPARVSPTCGAHWSRSVPCGTLPRTVMVMADLRDTDAGHPDDLYAPWDGEERGGEAHPPPPSAPVSATMPPLPSRFQSPASPRPHSSAALVPPWVPQGTLRGQPWCHAARMVRWRGGSDGGGSRGGGGSGRRSGCNGAPPSGPLFNPPAPPGDCCLGAAARTHARQLGVSAASRAPQLPATHRNRLSRPAASVACSCRAA